ncbi:tetratricopeptide repeat protein [Ferrimonas gelatinilytica]|uniref:Tetratricopeptide repeat protein n=1 Tax=Ferrimonas gelatinilytica TaxID=1255257 RepID=A0ABP9S6J7_9GAMM
MRWIWFAIALLTGCATSVPVAPPALWHDEGFDPTVSVPRPQQVFERSPAMNQLVQTLARSHNPQQALADYLFEEGRLEYDSRWTRNAAETFAAGAGNCMSLVLMTTALADALDLQVQYQLVEAPPVWDRQGGLYLINGHVNLRLTPRRKADRILLSSNATTIDFLPGNQLRGYDIRVLSTSELLARYYNNMAAEAMVAEERDRAYALLKMAHQQHPDYAAVWNTLGVLYRRHGMEREAEQVYRYAIQLPESELDALHNLAILLASQGRLQEWQAVHARLELKRIRNPYYYFDMGEQALQAGEFDDAVRMFQRALALAEYRHEFHFGLSRAYYRNGQRRLSERHLKEAEKLAPSDQKKRYQQKLVALRRH